MVQPMGEKQKMFQLLLKDKISYIKEYFIGFAIGVLISIISSYIYRDYQINRSYEKIQELTNKIDSLYNEIQVKEVQRLELEEEIKNKKIEIQEITVVRYKRPPINSPDSSFKYLQGFMK